MLDILIYKQIQTSWDLLHMLWGELGLGHPGPLDLSYFEQVQKTVQSSQVVL